MPIRTLMISEELKKELGTSTAIKMLIDYAYRHNLPPKTPPSGKIKLSVRFNEDESHLLFRGRTKVKYKNVELVGLALAAKEDQEQIKKSKLKTKSMDTLLLANGKEWRDSQRKMIPPIVRALSEGKIITMEASTGSGKGLALLGSGVLHGKKAVVAAPTIKIIRQLVEEYLEIKTNHNHAVVLGRQAFVSEYLLRESLDEQNSLIKDEINAWLETDKRDDVFNLSWLVSDLERSCPSLPDGFTSTLSLDNLSYTDDEKLRQDEGYQAWRDESMEAINYNPDFIFCSHTMLAVDAMEKLKETAVESKEQDVLEGKTKEEMALLLQAQANKRGAAAKGMFGNRVLLVDEAHLLESNIANFFSDSLSPYTLYLLAKAAGAPNIAAIKSAFNEMVRLGKKTEDRSSAPVETGSIEMAALERFVQVLNKGLATAKKEVWGSRALEGSLSAITRMLKNKKRTHQLYINYSPSYRYPRLTYGRYHLGKELGVIWGGVKSAALVSATLSVPERGYTYVKQTLFIPDDRFIQGEAVESSWLRDNVTLRLPNIPYPFLCRSKDEEDIDAWIGDLALTIDYVAQNAKGGVLVLFTSYEVIRLVANTVNRETYQRLIAQTPKTSFNKNEMEFRQRERPVWLATGRAWTGLDLRSDDNLELLTDLVITVIPFSMNRSVSYIKRIERHGFQNIAPYEAAIQLKQGVGRLKRQDDGVARNVWMLDNRAIVGPRSDGKLYTIPMKVFKEYKKRSMFSNEEVVDNKKLKSC